MSDILLHIWGSRGSRNTHGSRIGNSTSCYSLAVGEDLFVLDAGRGLVALSEALARDEGLRAVKRIHLCITHAHMDHWEGLKDAAWMWHPRNGLTLTVLGPKEALDTVRRAHEPPAYVPLEVLAQDSLAQLTFVELQAGTTVALPGATLRTAALHHYSGVAPALRHLDTLGYRLDLDQGPGIAYLSDHEPTPATIANEDALVATAALAIVDANYGEVAEHAFGHGSVESAAQLAGRHPGVDVLAGHHGPTRTDEAIEASLQRHGAGHANLAIAIEQRDRRWDAQTRRFVPR